MLLLIDKINIFFLLEVRLEITCSLLVDYHSRPGWLIGSSIRTDWDDTVTSLLRFRQSKMDTIFLGLLFQTTIYILWRERNSRRHGRACVTVEATTVSLRRWFVTGYFLFGRQEITHYRPCLEDGLKWVPSDPS